MKILLILLAVNAIDTAEVEVRPFIPESSIVSDVEVKAPPKEEEATKHKHFLAKEAMKPVKAVGHGLHIVGHKLSRAMIVIGDKTAPYQNFFNFISSVGGAASGAGILTGIIRNGGKL